MKNKSTILHRLIILLLCIAAFAARGAEQETDKRLPPMGGSWSLRKAAKPDPALPWVFLMGDSICNGYLAGVTKALDGKANVDAWITPTSQADKTLPATIAAICAAQKYSVVHFNLGLHGWQPGRIPPDQFEPLTRQLAQAWKKSAPQAVLIWATITPVGVKGEPEKLNPEIQPTIDRHNAMATRVMKSEGVTINDLDSLLRPHLAWMAGDMFHWKQEGRDLMARAVSEAILQALPPAK